MDHSAIHHGFSQWDQIEKKMSFYLLELEDVTVYQSWLKMRRKLHQEYFYLSSQYQSISDQFTPKCNILQHGLLKLYAIIYTVHGHLQYKHS